jgi:hypothetical protein
LDGDGRYTVSVAAAADADAVAAAAEYATGKVAGATTATTAAASGVAAAVAAGAASGLVAAGTRARCVLHRRGDGAGAEEMVAVTYESRPNTPASRPPSSSASQRAHGGLGSAAAAAEAAAGAQGNAEATGGGLAQALRTASTDLAAAHRFEPSETWHNASRPLALKKGTPSAMACRRILAHMNRHRPVASAFEHTTFVLRDATNGIEIVVDKYSAEPFFWPPEPFSRASF